MFVILGLAIAWWRVSNEKKKQFIVSTIIGGVIAFVLSRIASKLYYDPRPFVTEHVKPLIPHAADNGFPSDHALLTMTLSVATYFFSKKIAGLMMILTFGVGLARVLAKVHSPLDILGGWVFGFIGAVAGYYLMRWLFTKYVNKPKQAKAETN